MAIRYRYFMANLSVLWFLIVFYRTNPYYMHFLSAQAQAVLLAFAAAYTIGGSLYYRFNKTLQPTHAYEALLALDRWFGQIGGYLLAFPYDKSAHAPLISVKEKNAILILLVKAFYLPLMIHFLIGNTSNLQKQLEMCLQDQFVLNLQSLHLLILPMLINFIFITDTFLFTMGYAIELPQCRNVVKSVEPTLLGWIVALACYPPFNGVITNYILWYSAEAPVFRNVWASVIAGVAMVLCYSVYLWGSFSLGMKCSNLTNRGIVTNGVYAYVRHPAYIAKNLAWWIGILPVLSIPAMLSMASWSFLYFLRAITEEKHLLQDPDYQEYCQKVRYRFIPYVY